MPFSLNFSSTDATPASALPLAGAPSLSGQSGSSDDTASAASFDNCLAQADQTPLSLPAKSPAKDSSASTTSDSDDDSSDDSSKKSTSDSPAVVSADQLAALLALSGLVQLPPPVTVATPPPASSVSFDSNDGAKASDAPAGGVPFPPSTAPQNRIPGRYFPGLGFASAAAASLTPNSAAKDAPTLSTAAAGVPSLAGLTAVSNAALQTDPLASADNLSADSQPTTPAAPAASNPAAAPTVSAFPQPSVRQLLASGAPVIQYSFNPDGTAVASAPKAPSPADSISPVVPAAQDLPTSSLPATANFASPIPSTPQTAPSPGWSNPVNQPFASSLGTVPAQSDVSVKSLRPQQAAGSNVGTTEAAAVVSASVTQGMADRLVAAQDASSTLPAQGAQGIKNTAGAKIAAGRIQGLSKSASGVMSLNSKSKNGVQVVDDKELEDSTAEVGTRGAKRVISMTNDTSSSTAGARESDPFSALAAASLKSDSAFHLSDVAPTATTEASSHAAQAVREIRDIADGLWAVERNSVEVRFNFSDSEKLSVRVEYRDGTVQTTFRTDSPDLRDHLATAWQAQQAGGATDARPYRVADPVFGSSQNQNSDHSQLQDFSSNSGSSRQQRSSEQAGSQNSSPTFSFGRSASSTTTAAPAAPRLLRPETTLHLNAFA